MNIDVIMTEALMTNGEVCKSKLHSQLILLQYCPQYILFHYSYYFDPSKKYG